MKKILLLVTLLGTTFFLNAQLTGPTTPTGIVVNPGTCSINQVGANACPKICRNTFRVTPTGNPGEFEVYFAYFNPTAGVKGVRIEILCGTTILVDQCMDASTPKDVQYFKQYIINCANLSMLLVRLTPFTGGTDCGGGTCGVVEVSIGGGGLPVNFKSFTASRNKSNVITKWETSTEINNSGFAVERNVNGIWEQVAFVPSQANGGNSESELSYQFIDPNNSKGISQYRIKQVDIDNKSKYTEIRSVKGDGQVGGMVVYPNPTADGRVNVVFDNASVTRSIVVSDMSGRTVKQINSITNNNITIDNLQPGIYSLRVFVPETGEQSVQKIVVNKR